ncbi:MAG: LysR family transcriptional regulator, partial [Sulfuritalea sp.]|nr:LysR family transcriptional regulator [Sulfuritalea sp.]
MTSHGTFAAAAKEIGLTPAAVGLQIRSLEEELNQVLFDRGARSVVLNTAGRRVVPQVKELLLRYESLVASGDTDELSGTVVMGALVSALMGAFADALWSLK